MEIQVSSRRIAKILVAAILVLGFLSMLTGYYRMKMALVFNVGAELNIPTWYSSFILFTCSMLLGIIAVCEKQAGKRYAKHWSALSVVFLLLSIDEIAALHERMGAIVQNIFKTSILHELSWTVPIAVIVAFFIFAFAGFTLNLPAKTRRLFMLSAVLYLGGALVLEAVGGLWRAGHGEGNRVYTLMMTCEECLGEMLGITVFIYALASYIGDNIGLVSFRFLGKQQEPLPPDTHTQDDASADTSVKAVHN